MSVLIGVAVNYGWKRDCLKRRFNTGICLLSAYGSCLVVQILAKLILS